MNNRFQYIQYEFPKQYRPYKALKDLGEFDIVIDMQTGICYSGNIGEGSGYMGGDVAYFVGEENE